MLFRMKRDTACVVTAAKRYERELDAYKYMCTSHLRYAIYTSENLNRDVLTVEYLWAPRSAALAVNVQ